MALEKIKVVFVGDAGTGKTSLITRFLFDAFDSNYASTVGIDFTSKALEISETRTVRLQLWDTAGTERFRSLVPAYIRDSHAAVIVYDITSRESFEATKMWAGQVRGVAGPSVVVVLVGNKTDLQEARAVSTEEGQARAQELGCIFTETSAKAGHNVKTMFRTLAAAVPRPQPAPTPAEQTAVQVTVASDATGPGGTAATGSDGLAVAGAGTGTGGRAPGTAAPPSRCRYC